jgi:hypothetical protein
MIHELTLKLPEEIYQPLVNLAAQKGQTLEEAVLQCIYQASQQSVDDPIEQFIGAMPSNIPNWTDQHDLHLGQNLLNPNTTTPD